MVDEASIAGYFACASLKNVLRGGVGVRGKVENNNQVELTYREFPCVKGKFEI